MALEFMKVINRLSMKNVINKDILFKILTFAISPIDYPIQNGFVIKEINCQCKNVDEKCWLCEGELGISRFEKNLCHRGNCLKYKFRCSKCKAKIPRGVDDRFNCTTYRCYNEKCHVCGNNVRPYTKNDTYFIYHTYIDIYKDLCDKGQCMREFM